MTPATSTGPSWHVTAAGRPCDWLADSPMRTWIAARPVSAFVVLALLISWAAWLPLLAQTQGWVSTSPWPALHLLGSTGPAAAAVLVIGAARGRSGLADLGRR